MTLAVQSTMEWKESIEPSFNFSLSLVFFFFWPLGAEDQSKRLMKQLLTGPGVLLMPKFAPPPVWFRLGPIWVPHRRIALPGVPA